MPRSLASVSFASLSFASCWSRMSSADALYCVRLSRMSFAWPSALEECPSSCSNSFATGLFPNSSRKLATAFQRISSCGALTGSSYTLEIGVSIVRSLRAFSSRSSLFSESLLRCARADRFASSALSRASCSALFRASISSGFETTFSPRDAR